MTLTADLFPFETLLQRVRHEGEPRTDRTGTGALSLFAPDPLRYSLEGMRVPLIVSKEVPWRMALRELMWMLSGSTDVNELRKSSPPMARVWDNWADKDGSIGAAYGAQWRSAGGHLSTGDAVFMPEGSWAVDPKRDYGVDQLARVVGLLASSPDTRRAVVSLWSAPELDQMALEPCTVVFQFSLRGDRYDRLHLHVYQRSADLMLGVPFDLFQAGVLAHLVARELALLTGRSVQAEALTWSAGDVHVYLNQVEAVDVQLAQWREASYPNARLLVDPYPALRLLNNTLEPGHIQVAGYLPQPAVRGGAIAV